jgi:hypothetical protein
LDSYQQRAFNLLTSDATRRAFNIRAESSRLRQRYGRHKYGQSLLLARRLVEAGVRLVTVYWGGRVNNPVPHWDTHFNNNRRLKEELLPPFDRCFSAFLEDLNARGLLTTTPGDLHGRVWPNTPVRSVHGQWLSMRPAGIMASNLDLIHQMLRRRRGCVRRLPPHTLAPGNQLGKTVSIDGLPSDPLRMFVMPRALAASSVIERVGR